VYFILIKLLIDTTDVDDTVCLSRIVMHAFALQGRVPELLE